MRTVAGSKGRAEANEFVAEVTRCWRPGGRGSQPQPARPPHRPAPHRPPPRAGADINIRDGGVGWGGGCGTHQWAASLDCASDAYKHILSCTVWTILCTVALGQVVGK